MTYAKLIETARAAGYLNGDNPSELTELTRETLKQLSEDSRFAAVVAWLESSRESFVNAGSDQKMAGHHGALAHCQGSVHAHGILRGLLRQSIEPRPSSRRPSPPQE